MTVQEVFENWSAYLRDVDREDFKAQLSLLVSSETGDITLRNEVIEAAKGWLVRYEDEVRDPSEEAPCKRLVAAIDALNAAPQGQAIGMPAGRAEGGAAVDEEQSDALVSSPKSPPPAVAAPSEQFDKQETSRLAAFIRNLRNTPPVVRLSSFKPEVFEDVRVGELLDALSLPSARGHITELPAEFAALAEFYQVDDMPALIRTQAEHIERLQKKLPPLRGPESDPQNYRQG